MIPCKTDPDLHFDDKRAPEAARMCRACPAREACLALALDMESGQGPTGRYGVWGGLTPAERAAFAGVGAAVVEWWCEVCGTFARRGDEHDVACERRRAVAGLYGSGFSKSWNFKTMYKGEWCSCATANALPYNHADNTDLPRVRGDVHPPAVARGEGQDGLLLAPVQRRGEGSGVGEARTQGPRGMEPGDSREGGRVDAGREEPGVAGRLVHRAGQGLPNGAPTGSPEGEGERLRGRASTSDGGAARAAGGVARGGASHQRRSGGQAGAERVVRATADADAESPVACIRRPTATHTSCRCETCRPERNRMRKLTEAGLIPPSPDAQARAVLRGWMARGHSPAWIASATGLTLASAQHLTGDARRYDRKIGRHLAQVILRTDITSATAGLTDATGARRRLQALAAIGWSQMEIARRYDGHFVSLASIARGAQSHVGPRLHRLITTAYDDLAMTPGPHNRTRLDAARKGWAPPLAWDDIDDPNETPTGVEPTPTERETA